MQNNSNSKLSRKKLIISREKKICDSRLIFAFEKSEEFLIVSLTHIHILNNGVVFYCCYINF